MSAKSILAVPPVQPLVSNGISPRDIWRLTWPQALMMLFQFLVGFTDVTVAGRIHPHVQGAFGIIVQCHLFLLVLAHALVNGGVAAISQSLGAKLARRSERYMGLLFRLAAIFCVFILIVGFLLRRELLLFLGVPDEIFDLTLDLWVLFLGVMPGSYLGITTMAIFRAKKNVFVPLCSSVVVCVINAIGDLGFGLGWFGLPCLGAHGIIWASIISVSAGAVFNLWILRRSKIVTARCFAPRRWEKKAFPYILKVALPAGCSQFFWQLGYLVLFLIVNTLPADRVSASAGLASGLRIEALVFLPAMAFSFTASILVGHCLGAGNPADAKKVGLRITLGGALIMSLVAALLYPFLDYIAAYVAPDPMVSKVAISYMIYNLLGTPFSVTSAIMAGIFSGAGATIYSLVIFSSAIWLVRLPLAYYIGHFVWQDASGVFVAMLVSQAVQACACIYVFLFMDWFKYSSTAKRFKRTK